VANSRLASKFGQNRVAVVVRLSWNRSGQAGFL